MPETGSAKSHPVIRAAEMVSTAACVVDQDVLAGTTASVAVVNISSTMSPKYTSSPNFGALTPRTYSVPLSPSSIKVIDDK